MFQNQINKDNFLYPHSRYRGKFKPKYLAFNANLQIFAQRVTFISNLETNGKLSPQESYKKIESLWQQLQSSYMALGIDQDISS